MRGQSVVCCYVYFVSMLAVPVCAPAQAPAVALYDTVNSSQHELSAEALTARQGWVEAGMAGKAPVFSGDAVLLNGKMAVILRQRSGAAELYAVTNGIAALRAKLRPIVAGGEAVLSSVRQLSVDASMVEVEAVFKTKGGTASVCYSLGAAYPILATKGVSGVAGQRLESPSRIGVVPDFFADDTLIDARTITIDRTELAADNFFMNMLENGNSIVTTIWDRNEKDIELTFAGAGESRNISGVNVSYGVGRIWIAIMEQPNLWGTVEISGANQKAVTPISWKPTFPARWKGDFVRVDRTVDSWDFSYNPGVRSKWAGTAGMYNIPCWIDEKKGDCKALIEPPVKFPNGEFAGPFVVYPLDRVKDVKWNLAGVTMTETPLEQMTVADVMRNSMGIGPCQNILDSAGQGLKSKGIFTCAVHSMLPAIYSDRRQKDERVFIDRMLKSMNVFMRAVEDRVNSYVDFREEMLKYLAGQKQAHPEQLQFIARLEDQTKRIQAAKMHGSKRVEEIAGRLRAETLEDTGKVDVGREMARVAEDVAVHQDNAAAKCRHAVKILRQLATIEAAIDPKTSDICKEIKKRTQEMLRGGVGHEDR